MKRIKIIFSVLIIMSIIMTSFNVFAYDDIPAEDIIDYIFRFDVGNFSGETVSSDENDPDVERINFLGLIGVWDDVSISKDKLVTMTELSVIMSKVKLGSSNALMEVYKQNPDENNASYKTAIECLLYATGYNHKINEYGGDNALVIAAADVDLMLDNIENINAFITRGELAKLIMKALTLDLCVTEYPETGGYRYTVIKGKNLLNSVHNIYDVSGFVNAVPGFAVYGGASLREGYVEIGRANINASGQDFTKFLGKYVTAYAVLDDVLNEYKIIYVQENTDSVNIEVNFSDIVSLNDNYITYAVGDDECDLSLFGLKTVVENGKKISSISQLRDYYSNSEGKVIFTSSEKDGNIDIAIIYKYNYFIVDYVDTSLARIGLKNAQTYKGETYIQLDERGINSVSIYGVQSDYKDIPLNSTIKVLECHETNYFRIEASSERQKGEVASVYDNTIEVAGKSYRISKDLLKHIKYCEENNITGSDRAVYPQLGETYTFTVMDGIVVGITVSDDLFSYGVIKSAMKSRTSIDPEVTLRVFTEEGEWKNFEFAEKIELEGTPGVSKSEVTSYIETNANEVVGGLIRYKVNGSDKITSLYTAKDNGLGEINPDDVNLVDELTVEVDWTKWFIKGSKYLFDSRAKVFVIPTNKTKEAEYKVLNPTAFENGMVYTISLYNPDDYLQVGAVVYNGNLSDAAVASNTPTFFYVENIRKVVIDKEDLVYGYKVTGMEGIRGGGKGTGTFEERSYYLKEDDYNRKMAAGEEFYVGDFLKIDVVGTNLVDWSVDMRDGKPNISNGNFEIAGTGTVVTEETNDYYMYDYETNTVNSYELLYGKIIRINYEEFLILVDCGEYGLRTVGTRILGSIDRNSHNLKNLSISNFHAGEEVQIITGGPNAYMTLKYVN